MEKEHPDVHCEDVYAAGGSKLSEYMRVKKFSEDASQQAYMRKTGSGERARQTLHANEARSSGSGTSLVQEPTVGSSISKPRILGLLSVVLIEEESAWRLWKDGVFMRLYDELQSTLGDQKSVTFPRGFSVLLLHQGFGAENPR